MTDNSETDKMLNSIADIRKFIEEGQRPFAPGEFIEFWKSLTDKEKQEFENTPLK